MSIDKLALEKEFRINNHNKYKNRSNLNKKILNRRKKKLDELLNGDSDYFSENSIMQRDPILYEIYVGSHRRKTKVFNEINTNINVKMSKVLMDELEREIHTENLQNELDKEYKKYGKGVIVDAYRDIDNDNDNLLEDEIDELIRLMSIRFLMGGDSEFFNYDEVDNNELYDDLEVMVRDDEDKYFDGEDNIDTNSDNHGESVYTGIQDY